MAGMKAWNHQDKVGILDLPCRRTAGSDLSAIPARERKLNHPISSCTEPSEKLISEGPTPPLLVKAALEK